MRLIPGFEIRFLIDFEQAPHAPDQPPWSGPWHPASLVIARILVDSLRTAGISTSEIIMPKGKVVGPGFECRTPSGSISVGIGLERRPVTAGGVVADADGLTTDHDLYRVRDTIEGTLRDLAGVSQIETLWFRRGGL